MSVATAPIASNSLTSSPLPANEHQRLAALKEYNLLDTLPDDELDNITRLASAICGTPVSLITLLDEGRQWFKSRHGPPFDQTPRDLAFCAHAIMTPGETMIIPSMMEDERFADHPFVTGDLRVTSYAGVPLVNRDGYALGTLCVIDNKPNHLSDEQIETLELLARQVMCQFELRRKNRELDESKRLLETAYEDIEQFSRVIAHDLKSPCANVYTISALLLEALEGGEDTRLSEQARMLHQSSKEMSRMIDGVLQYAKSSDLEKGRKETIDLGELVEDLCDLVGINAAAVYLPEPSPVLRTYRVPLQHILLNLLVNAMKHGDKARTEVKIDFEEGEFAYTIRVADNGPGMSEEMQARAFDLFYTGERSGIYGEGLRGHGIGLATVRTLVGKLGGTIRVEASVQGEGTTFVFTVAK